MDRETKFRAWNKELNEMIYLESSGLQYFDFEGSYSLGFTVEGYSGFWAHEQYSEASKKANSFPIMQYTGLKDKNGKDEYHKDIVQCFSEDGEPTVRGIVEWSKLGYWHLRVRVDGNDLISEGEGEMSLYSKQNEKGWNLRREVIGNVHENPKLLLKI